MRKVSAIILSICFLSGCSTIPVKDTADYLGRKLYHRIPYEVDGNYRVTEIFYATDRKVMEKSGELYFEPEIGDGLTTGTLRAKIDPGLTIGKVAPMKLKRKGKIGVQEVIKMSDEDFMKQLSDAVEKSPHQSLLVLIYGFKDNFEMTATKAAYFAYLLDVNTPVLLFDWPGDQSVAPWGYKKAQALATASGPYLGEVLTKVIHQAKPQKLWVESSSLGCQVVCDAFEWMYKQNDLADTETEITHVIMSAPDVSKDEFDLKFKDEITALTEKLTTYVSSDDDALLVSEIINWDKRLGFQETKVEKNGQFEEAKDLLYLKSLDPGRVSIVDVTLINNATLGHGYDLEVPEIYDDFYMRIFGTSSNTNRRLYLIKVKENVDYWVMR